MAKAKPKKKSGKSVSVKKVVAKVNNNTSSKSSNIIIPQGRAKLSDLPLQCWAHSRNGKRCTAVVPNREGEPIPIPYCEQHLKSGDGALKEGEDKLYCFGYFFMSRSDSVLNSKHSLFHSYTSTIWKSISSAV